MKNDKYNVNNINRKDKIRLSEFESKYFSKKNSSTDKSKAQFSRNQLKEEMLKKSIYSIYKNMNANSGNKVRMDKETKYNYSYTENQIQHQTDRKIAPALRFNTPKNNNLSLRKDILTETNSILETNSPVSKLNFVQFKTNMSNNINKPKITKHTEQTKSEIFEINNILSTKNSSIKNPSQIFKILPTSSQQNLGLIYSDLARQLKIGKNTNRFLQNNSKFNFNNNFLEKDSLLSSTKEKEINQSVEPVILNKSKISRTNTKDNSVVSLKMSFNNFKTKNLNLGSEVECPEELHAFYVNLIQQNKTLALKFDNVKNTETDILESEN